MTLVELLVVVTIVFVIMLGVGVLATAKYEKRRPLDTTSTSDGEARTPAPEAWPRTDRAVVRIDLASTGHASGLSRYRATFDGHFDVLAVDRGPTRLWFPFPSIAEASSVHLAFTGDGVSLPDPPGVVYAHDGIRWEGTAPAARFGVHVHYVSEGSGRFAFVVPRTGRIGELDVEIRGEGLDASAVTEWALPPTDVEEGLIAWRYRDLVTDRAVELALPRSLSPLGRTLLMCKLAALAVLLFGAGFWYFGELYEPGRLDRFRWGHFLLLATTFSLFFVVFAVAILSMELAAASALVASASVSLPLVVLHVSRIFDLRFALYRALPLAVYALSIVAIGVYGGSHRPAAFVGAAVIGVAVVTWTYRRWCQGREAHALAEAHASEASAVDPALGTPSSPAGPGGPGHAPRRGAAPPDGEEDHCIACGARGRASPFCAACGVRRPVAIGCGACHTETLLPVHLLPSSWSVEPLHCHQCGHRIRAAPSTGHLAAETG